MLAPLLAVALIALTVLALLLAGVLAAVATAIVLLNVLATIICSRSRALRKMHAEHWRPSSFRAPPQPADEAGEEPAPSLTIHRL
ncbi:MAG: hypothetical protein QOI18_1987 [Solirubrobacteraceae bacterium]|jgi:hypothetical protein|nr:hypothetical protein [Solirubrobacteraceae bacterium]MEA2225918.1 hypothetical protein [Solirubrobacteraceae bacterium]MEA2333684.1 hypothetical protein [Solirubrobacteraceae bacterium]